MGFAVYSSSGRLRILRPPHSDPSLHRNDDEKEAKDGRERKEEKSEAKKKEEKEEEEISIRTF